MRRISHRELRNNSSEVLRAVDNGESFEITNYGRVVALIVPANPTPLDRLRAAGRTQPAELPLDDLLDTEPQTAPGDSGTELDAMRSDR
jgi:prevent-host-death family protein